MNIRMTPIVALAMVIGLAACQDEESPEAVEDTGTEESSEEEDDSTGTDSAVTEQPAVDDDTTDPVAESESAEVEAETPQTGEASQDATNSVTEDEDPATTADAPATDAADAEGTAGAEDEGSLDELLTPEGFDADRVLAAIDESDLDDARKDELRDLTRAAEEDPSQIDAAIEALREDLLEDDGADAGDAAGADRYFAAAPGSLFSPERFGGASEYTIDGARLAGMSTAIFTQEAEATRD